MSSPQLGEIARRFGHDLVRHDVTGIAAELAYRFLFALFPFALFVAAIGSFVASWFGIDNPAQELVRGLGDNLPPDLARSIQPELEQVIGQTSGRLVSFGALAALWAATGGTNALIKAMNRALEVEETRPVLFRFGLAAVLTILGGVGILLSFVTIVGGALLTEELAEGFGLSGAAWAAASLLRWPIVFALLVAAVSILFRFAPNARIAWRWILAGAALFATGWLAATWGFAWYVGSFGNYGAMYGSLGAVIVLMLWFYLTGLLLVGAAELITGIASVVEPESLTERREAIAAERGTRKAEDGAKRAASGLLDRLRGISGGRQQGSDGPAAPAGGVSAPNPRPAPGTERRVGPGDRRGTLRGEAGRG